MKSFFFVKLLIILSIICVCLLLTIKINEKFEFFDSPNSNSIKLSIESGSEKGFIVLKWKSLRVNILDSSLLDFIIVFYKNSQGPYLIPIPTKTNSELDKSNGFITHTFKTLMNVEYKFAVIEKISDRVTEIDKYVKVKQTPPGLDIKYVNDTRAKVICKADGSYEIIHSKKCKNNELPIIATFRDDNGNIKSFGEGIHDMNSGYDDHQNLMRELTYSPKIKLKFM